MLIYWNKRKFLHKKKVQLPQDCLGTPTWQPWRHVKTLYSIKSNGQGLEQVVHTNGTSCRSSWSRGFGALKSSLYFWTFTSAPVNSTLRSYLLGSFSKDDGDDNDNEQVKNAIGLLSKTTTLLNISWPLLHDYDVKMPDFTFYGGRKQATTKFSFSF